MTLFAVVREAVKNILSGTSRFTIFGVALSVVIGGLTFVDSLAIAQQVAASNAFRLAGGATVILTARGQVSGAACQNLADIPGVASAGAMRESVARISVSTLPDAPLPLYEVSPGFPEVVSASVEGAGLIISAEVGSTLAIRPGGTIPLAAGAERVAGIFPYPPDGRRPGLGYAALAVTNDLRPFDECWVAAWPRVANLHTLLLTTLTPEKDSTPEQPIMSQLNSSLGEMASVHETFLSRTTRGAAPLTAALAVLLGYIAIRVRRLHLASALHSGVARLDLLGIHTLETWAWSVPAALTGMAVGAVMTRIVPAADQWAQFMTVLGIPLAGFAGAFIGTILATLTTREKQLFRAFKDR